MRPIKGILTALIFLALSGCATVTGPYVSREEIARAKYIPRESVTKVAEIRDAIDEHIKQLHPSGVSK